MHLSVSCQVARRLQAHYCRTDAGDEGRAPEARRFYHKPAPKCANEKCGSVNCKFYESRPRKSGGASDRYKCVECGRRLAYRPGFLGRHYDDAAISGAIGDATDSKSLGAAARSVPKYSQSKRVPVRSTVLRRMQHAKRTTAKIPENIPIRVGGKWNADETCFPADKGGRYMSGVVDAESRFMLANETHPETEKLQTYDATDMFRRAGRIARSTPQAWFFVDLYRHVQAGRPYSKGGTRRAHKIYAERFCARVQECDSEVRKIPQKRPKARARTHRVSTEPPHQQQPL